MSGDLRLPWRTYSAPTFDRTAAEADAADAAPRRIIRFEAPGAIPPATDRPSRTAVADPHPWPSLPRSARERRADAAPSRVPDDRWPELPDDDGAADEPSVSALWEWLRERERQGRVR